MLLAGLSWSAVAQPEPKFNIIQRLESGESFLSFDADSECDYHIQASDDLKQWKSWLTRSGKATEMFTHSFRPPTNQIYGLFDPGARFSKHRFYRAIEVTDPNAIIGDHLQTGQGETPESVAVGPDGTAYLGMAGGNRIKKVTADGVVSDFVQFSAPGTATGVKLDPAGNLYIVKRSDPANTGIWKVSPDGVPSLFSSIPGTQFLNDLVFDDRGNLYVTDTRKGAIFKVDPNGQSGLWKEDRLLRAQMPAAPPVPITADWVGANGIAFNPGRRVCYVMNTVMGGVIEIPMNADGSAGAASLFVQDNLIVGADGITLDAGGMIYVGVNWQNRIAGIRPDGKLSILAEGGLLNRPSSVAFGNGPAAGTLYICNFANPTSGGNPQWAGLLKLDVGTAAVKPVPVTYLNHDVVLSPIHTATLANRHASVAMQWGAKMVYADPTGGPALYEALPKADLVVVTHLHGDHYDTNSLRAVKGPNTIIFVPQTVFDMMPDDLKSAAVVMKNGEVASYAGVGIEAVPSYNFTRPNHPKGRDNGYVLTFAGKRIYIPGDTEDVPEMRALKNIDVAFMCMNPPFTMDETQAASAVREFKPRVVYPFHFLGAKVLPTGAPDFTQRVAFDIYKFRDLVGTDLGIEVRIRQWYSNVQIGDRLATDQGDLQLAALNHASVFMNWAGKNIYSDPAGRVEEYQSFPKANLVLVTHFHNDHFDPNVIEVLKGTETTILAPQNVIDLLPSALQSIATVMANGAKLDLLGLTVEAVPAYNITPERAGHPKGRDNGYVLTMGGKRVYISGDTEDTPEMRALKDIDVAFLSMSIPSNMTADQAASALRDFKPGIVYPYHFFNARPGNSHGTVQDVMRLKRLIGENANTEVRMRPWYSTF